MKLITCPQKYQKCVECSLSDERFEEIKAALKDGGLVVYPTDTLYALGADPFNEDAIDLLYSVKRRPKDMPLSIAFGDLKSIEEVAFLNGKAKELIKRRLPGPLTILVNKRKGVKLSQTLSKNEKIGIRMPNHPFALRLAGICGPVTATSANLHGGREPRDVTAAMEELGPSVNIYVDCGECDIGKPSSIIDITSGRIEEVRSGPIAKEMLQYGRQNP